MSTDFNRRDLLKFVSAATLATPLALAAPDPGAPLFFTKDEFALLDTLSELVIPEDSHSPGARAAGVAAYIDKTVAEAFLPEDKTSWKTGLAAVNQMAKTRYDKAFLKCSKEQQIAVLKQLAAADEAAESNKDHHRKKNQSERFFGQLKYTTAFAYYSSSIGIHKEMDYKGNVLLKEFAGYMPDAELPPASSLPTA